MPESLHISPTSGPPGTIITVTGVRTHRDDGTPVTVKEVCIGCLKAQDCKGCTPTFQLDGSTLTFKAPGAGHKGRDKGNVAVKYAGHGEDYSVELFKILDAPGDDDPPPPVPKPLKHNVWVVSDGLTGKAVAVFKAKNKLTDYLKAHPGYTKQGFKLNG